MSPLSHPARAALLFFLAATLVPDALRAQTSYNVTLRSHLTQYATTAACWGYSAPDGTEIALWGHLNGTSFVDATDPSNAVEIWNLPGPTSIWREMKTYEHYAYIVTEGQGTGAGLQIVDLADPLAPVLVSTYTGSGFSTAHTVWIDVPNGVLYAPGGAAGGMHVLSLADPENPVQLSYFPSYYIHDLWVGDGVGYAGAIFSGSLRIINASNPASLSTSNSHFYSGAATHNAWPNASKSHVLTTDETGGGHVKIWNIASLPSISLAAEFELPGHIVHNVHLRDDMTYMAYYTAGTRIVDVTDPTDPIEVGYYDTSNISGGYNGCWDVYPFRSDDVYYASDRQTGLWVLEFTGGFAGRFQGVVRNAQGGAPISGAHVELVGTQFDFETNGAGAYSARLSGGTYTAVTSRFGFQSDTSLVALPEQGTLVHDVNLVPLPVGNIELELLSSRTGLPVPGAIVSVDDSPLAGLVSNASGKVLLNGLPAGPTWTARIGRFGSALTSEGIVATNGVTTPKQVVLLPGFHDDFEADQGWNIGAAGDLATDGLWQRAIPVGSFSGGIVGPDLDASPSGAGFAFVTESHNAGSFVATSDVDGGKTTLLTPVFDGTGVGDLTVTYKRWFSNRAPSPSSDPFRADVSTDGGGSWTNLETVTAGTDSWAAVQIPLSGLVTLTSTMRLRFVAEDTAPDTYVEAGVDDVLFTSTATSAPDLAASVSTLRLESPTPNPFRETARLAFEIPRSGAVTLRVHDVAGRAVATLLAADRLGAGSHRVEWNGRDDRGALVAPGIYFAKLVTAGGTLTEKITRLR